MATLVANSREVVACAARTSGVNTSWGPSKVKAPSTPRASSRRAWSAASSRPDSMVSILIGRLRDPPRQARGKVRMGRRPRPHAATRRHPALSERHRVHHSDTLWGMSPIYCTPDEAAALIRTRDTIGFGLGPANPDAFFTALGRRDDWEDLLFGGALLLGFYPVLAHPNVTYRCGFFGPAERMMLAKGANIDLVPGGFRQMGPILRRYAPRVMTAQAAAPGADGMVNLSLAVGGSMKELIMAGQDPERLLVIEVNPNLPRTSSLPPEYTNTLPLDLVDVVIENDAQPFTLPEAPTSGRVKGCASFSITTSTRSRGRVLVYSGGSDEVRGRLGLTSMTSRRSGSCPAMISSFMDPPTVNLSLAVGGSMKELI